MNKLIPEQMKLFEPNLSEEEYNQRFESFAKLYFKLREKEDKRLANKLSLKQKQKLHPILLILYKLVNRLNGLTYEIINDKRTKTDKPIIFAVTHIGKFEIQVITEAIKEHSFLLGGDFEHLQGSFDAPFLALNGVFYFNENVKSDRKAVTEKMINHLKNGGNIMYFPEGRWNLSPNLPVLPLFWGIIDVSRYGQACIVPIAVEQYDKHLKINIGNLFDVNNYENNQQGKTNAITDLRNIMAAMKYEIWETESIVSRNYMQNDYWFKNVIQRFDEFPLISKNIAEKFARMESDFSDSDSAYYKYNMMYADRMTFKPKSVVWYKDVFEHLNKITPRLENAFLFNKRLK